MSRIATGVLAGLLVATGLVGCAQARPAGPGRAGPPSAAEIDLATRSGSWPETENVLQNTVNRLDNQCLRTAGFEAPAAPAVRTPVPEDDKSAVRMKQRESNGYGIATPPAASTLPAAEKYGSTLSAADQARYVAAQFGDGRPTATVALIAPATAEVPSAGCAATARRKVAGDVRTWARLGYVPDLLDTRLSFQAVGDTRYKAALASWRTCLKTRGFDYASPEAAQGALRKEYASTGRTAGFKDREIAVAVADGTCAATARLSAVSLKIRRSLVARLPADQLALLRSLNADRRAALARARALPDASGEGG